VKVGFGPSSSLGSKMGKGPGARFPQPKGPLAGQPCSVVISVVDLQAMPSEVL
jgi:hypothetical protein